MCSAPAAIVARRGLALRGVRGVPCLAGGPAVDSNPCTPPGAFHAVAPSLSALSTAQAQNKLTTIFASNNGLSGTSMVFFDVTVANPVRLTGFELNSYATVNSRLNLQVYTCASTYVGNETNAVRLDADRPGQRHAVGAGQDSPRSSRCRLLSCCRPAPTAWRSSATRATATRTATARTRATATAS
jgi:hypothetical protein